MSKEMAVWQIYLFFSEFLHIFLYCTYRQRWSLHVGVSGQSHMCVCVCVCVCGCAGVCVCACVCVCVCVIITLSYSRGSCWPSVGMGQPLFLFTQTGSFVFVLFLACLMSKQHEKSPLGDRSEQTIVQCCHIKDRSYKSNLLSQPVTVY